MTRVFAFALCVLGSKAIIDAWFKGSIFAWGRAWTELLRDEGKWWLTRKFGELMTCPFCFSYHSSLWLSLFCLPAVEWWMLPPWWLAVRTGTGLLELFESLIDKKGEEHVGTTGFANGESDGDIRSSGGSGLFD